MGVDYVGRVAPRPAPPEDAEKTAATERAHRPRSVEPVSEDRWEGEGRLPGEGHAPEEHEEEQEEGREEAGEDAPEGEEEGGAEGSDEAGDAAEGEGGERKQGRRLDAQA